MISYFIGLLWNSKHHGSVLAATGD